MDNTNDVYINYHAITGEITEGLSRMAKICDQLEMHERSDSLQKGKKKLQSHKFAVGILGEFKRGKSTVINAILGKEIMPADILPCSATMNRVSYDMQPSVQLNMMDGTKKNISVDELSEYVTKTNEKSSANAALVEEATVFYPCRFCQNGVDIVDTPGLNDDERMNKITEETIPKLDAVIMVLVPDSPYSISESNFVRNKLMCSDISRLIFLVNKIDTVRPIDRVRVVEGIRQKIKESVLNKTIEIYGEDSERYISVKEKIADIKIFPISAQNALDGRIGAYSEDASENEKAISKSGIVEFEKHLSKMLTEERGFLELGGPLSQIIRCAVEAKGKVQTYIDAMNTDNETFMITQRELLEKQQEIRKEKAAERERLQKKAKEVKFSLTNKTDLLYCELENEAETIVGGMQLENTKIKLNDNIKQALIKKTMDQIDDMISKKMSVFCERISGEIDSIVGKEAVHVTDFLTKTQVDISNVMSKISNTSGEKVKGALVDLGGGLATLLLTGGYGWGGVVSGFRSAGVKGALLGGASGFAASVVAGIALSCLSLPALPVALIAGGIGSVVGSTVCDKIFIESKNLKELEKIKEKLRESIKQSFIQMRTSRELETWIEKTVTGQFEALCDAMDEQCESAIRDAENTISKIKMDLARNTAEKEASKDNYLDIYNDIDEIIKTLEPVREKLLNYAQ